MKTLRERFEEEYTAVSVPTDNKRGFNIVYKYYAPWYIWNLPGKKLAEVKKRILVMSIFSFICYIGAGIQDTDMNRNMLPVVFEAVALCAQVLELFGVFRFRFAKYKTDRMTYQSVNLILRTIPLASSLCLLMVAGIGLLDMEILKVNAAFIIALIGNLVSAAVSLKIFLEYRKIPFRTEKNSFLQEAEQML